MAVLPAVERSLGFGDAVCHQHEPRRGFVQAKWIFLGQILQGSLPRTISPSCDVKGEGFSMFRESKFVYMCKLEIQIQTALLLGIAVS
jgi:hypothetical protein